MFHGVYLYKFLIVLMYLMLNFYLFNSICELICMSAYLCRMLRMCSAKFAMKYEMIPSTVNKSTNTTQNTQRSTIKYFEQLEIYKHHNIHKN